MKVRAKVQVHSVTQIHGAEGHSVVMHPVTADASPEHQSFSKHTPSGTFTMHVSNPAVAEFFKPGRTFYVDFSRADEQG